jgi:hypothetical protein
MLHRDAPATAWSAAFDKPVPHVVFLVLHAVPLAVAMQRPVYSLRLGLPVVVVQVVALRLVAA